MLSLSRISRSLLSSNTNKLIFRQFANRSLGRTGFDSFSPFSLFGSRSSDLNDLFRDFDRIAENMWNLNNRLNLAKFNEQKLNKSDNIQPIDQDYNNAGDIAIGDEPEESINNPISSSSPGPASLDFLKSLDVMKETPIKLDLEEEADKYIVKVTIPDFTKDQVRLRVKNGALSITAEQKLEKKDDNSYIDSVKRVTQSIRLPQNVKMNEISARHEGNVLFITIPKKDITEKESKGQNIQIQ